MTQYTATGNTYRAKEVLKKSGFTWDTASKKWSGGEAAKKEFERITTATHSVANRNATKDISIVPIDENEIEVFFAQ